MRDLQGLDMRRHSQEVPAGRCHRGESDSVAFLCFHDTEHRLHESISLQYLLDGLADLGFLVLVPPPFRLRRDPDSKI